jgi:hypothetical protein
MAIERHGSWSPTALSEGARSLMGIPLDAELPTDPGDLYDLWFAGRGYAIDQFHGWRFEPRGQDLHPPFLPPGVRHLDCCLDHRTAQFVFGLDEALGVHVLCKDWVQIASSFTKLVEHDAIEATTHGHRLRDRHYLGDYASFEDFRASNRSLLARFQEVDLDPGFAAAFASDESVVLAGRVYSDEYSITAIEIMRETSPA